MTAKDAEQIATELVTAALVSIKARPIRWVDDLHENIVKAIAKAEWENSKELQDDLLEIIRLLGLGDHARTKSPHRVFQDEVIPAIRSFLSAKAEEKAPAQERDTFDDSGTQP